LGRTNECLFPLRRRLLKSKLSAAMRVMSCGHGELEDKVTVDLERHFGYKLRNGKLIWCMGQIHTLFKSE
jgi:hypothetical protein